jgi:hypothetical protein
MCGCAKSQGVRAPVDSTACGTRLSAGIDCTVRKMDRILRSIERRPQMQFSMARRFKLQLLCRYSVKFCKMRSFTLGEP